MNPLSLRLRNLRTFEALELDLPEGCVSVTGDNGAGKSTLVNAIDASLFGPDGRSFRPFLTRGAASTELMVELIFDHAGETYRVRRGFSARGSGKSTLDLEQAHDTLEWLPLTLGSAKETQALLEQLLGFNRQTFRASSFLVQKDASAFTLADAAERKKILAGALGLERFKRLLEAVRRDLRATRDEVTRIDGRLQGVTADALRAQRDEIGERIFLLEQAESAAVAALAAGETALGQASSAWQAEQTREAERAAAVSRRDAAVTAHIARAQLREDALQAATALTEIKAELDTLPSADVSALEAREQELAASAQQHKDALRERDEARRLRELREAEKRAIEAQAAAAQRKADELDTKIAHIVAGELDHCPTCAQELGAEARDATAGSLRAQAQTAADEAKALLEGAAAITLPDLPEEPEPLMLAGDLETVRTQIRQGREAALNRARLTERLATHTQTISAASDPAYLAELGALGEAQQAAEDALAALPPASDAESLQTAARTAAATVGLQRAHLQEAQRDKAIEQERLSQHALREEQLATDLAGKEECLQEIDLLAILERAYGPDGIPALILENAAIPQLESEASRILGLLGGPVSRVELRTDRAKQDGGVRDDVLDIVCITDTGDCVYDDLSGGEGFRVDVALRLALAQLLATRRGAEVRLLVIDEPDGLDASGKQALIEILRDLEQRGGLSRIYLISHDAEIRDSFDSSIVVVKDPDGRSRVEGALAEVIAA